jgi:hypothetical protein
MRFRSSEQAHRASRATTISAHRASIQSASQSRVSTFLKFKHRRQSASAILLEQKEPNSVRKNLSCRAFLKIKDDDGECVYVATNEILQSPKLQSQCIEKATLKRIINKLQKRIYQTSVEA